MNKYVETLLNISILAKHTNTSLSITKSISDFTKRARQFQSLDGDVGLYGRANTTTFKAYIKQQSSRQDGIGGRMDRGIGQHCRHSGTTSEATAWYVSIHVGVSVPVLAALLSS